MKLLTRNTDYAIRALAFLAKQKGRSASVPTLIADLRIPRPFLRKIMQVLEKKGILVSRKGIGGGFSMALGPGKIFVVDLIKIFQGPLRLNECFFKKKICPNKGLCKLKKKIDKIEKDMISELRSITIASLLS